MGFIIFPMSYCVLEITFILYTYISNYINKTFLLLTDVPELFEFLIKCIVCNTVTHLTVFCLWRPTIYLIILWKNLTCFWILS